MMNVITNYNTSNTHDKVTNINIVNIKTLE